MPYGSDGEKGSVLDIVTFYLQIEDRRRRTAAQTRTLKLLPGVFRTGVSPGYWPIAVAMASSQGP